MHSTTGLTPFYALYGYHPDIRANIEADVPGGEAPNARLRVEQLQVEREELAKRWDNAMLAQKKWYDKKHTLKTFALGDKVMLLAKNIRQLRPSKKLANRYLSLFKIAEVVGTHRQAYPIDTPRRVQNTPGFPRILIRAVSSTGKRSGSATPLD